MSFPECWLKLASMVQARAYQHHASDAPKRVAPAAIDRGYAALHVLFYHDGVHDGNRRAAPSNEAILSFRPARRVS